MLKMSESTEILMDSMSEQTAAAKVKETIEFDEAFSLHHRTVFRAARSVVQDCGLAEDLTAEGAVYGPTNGEPGFAYICDS